MEECISVDNLAFLLIDICAYFVWYCVTFKVESPPPSPVFDKFACIFDNDNFAFLLIFVHFYRTHVSRGPIFGSGCPFVTKRRFADLTGSVVPLAMFSYGIV